MDENNWQKVKDTFLAVLEKDERSRSDFLEEIGSTDPALRQEVESLLDSHDEIEDFIEEPAFPLSELFSDAPDPSGRQIGNYKIIRQIGAGGMGAVFLAERSDGEFSQQAAIKIIRQAIVETEIVNRFKRERQILASLNHPNIARLLDGGVTPAGEPFLAMEYVEGTALHEFVEGLDVTTKLRLFIKVCAAVSFAHRSLIVHRDLKPSNIIVTADGEPKLLDFGLAKVLDFELDSTHTATVFRALTPAYASPEQLAGEEVGTASDVYSLGILLYEMLTGRRPFDLEGKTLEQIIRTVAENNPSLPSRIENSLADSRYLKGDLDNIILFALRKEPDRRYNSVEQFADDIRRHLNHLPVAARPNTSGYRMKRFVQRNWAATAVAVLLLLSVTGGVAATIWQARVATAQRDRAEERFNDVRKLSSSLLFEISPQIERLPGSTQARETIVRRALEYLDSLAAESANNDSLQSELATAYEQVGNVQGKPGKANLGDLKGASDSYHKALQIRLALIERHPDDYEQTSQLAANYYANGEILWWSSKIDEAISNYRLALGMYEDLLKRQPGDLATEISVIRTYLGIASVLSFNSERTESIAIYRQIIARLDRLNAANPSNIEIQRRLENSHIHLAYDLSWEDLIDEATKEVDEAKRIGETLLAENANDSEVRRAMWLTYFLAGAIFEDADPQLSRKYIERSIELVKLTTQADAMDFQAKHDLAQSYSKLSVSAITEKQFDKAVGLLTMSQNILNDLSAAEPRHTGYKLNMVNNLTRLADAQEGKGDLQTALQTHERAAAFQEELRRADPESNMHLRSIGVTAEKVALILEKLNQFEQAAQRNRQGLAMFGLLRDKNVLEEYDKKTVTAMEDAIARCESKLTRSDHR